ncbi:MAG: hypothetical protein J6X79_03595 [Bacteroidales bacterium]|nr:hypothetical protein [Bacteroidales bacterium]
MKRLLLLFALLPLTLQAQDSAEVIVNRYLRMLNYEELPQDSTLVMETTISFHGSNDTFTLRRWFTPPTMMRVEVWRGNNQTDGYCTNGGDRHREYVSRAGWWRDMEHSLFHEKIAAYDFRGPLYNWQMFGTQLTYKGVVMAKGQRLQVVRAEQRNNYTRYFFFDEQSGLLVLMQEKDETPVNNMNDQVLKQVHTQPIEYKVVHEYLPMGKSLIASQESFMREGLLTIMETKARFIPRDNLIFNKD